MRTRPGSSGQRGWVWIALGAALLTAWTGCGEQDLYSPPTSPYGIVGRLALPSVSTGVDVVGDYAFVAGGQAGLHVVDISDPAHPVLVFTHDTLKRADAVKVVASPQPDGSTTLVALVVEGTEGLTTYDVTHPDSVYAFEAGSTAVDGKGLDVVVPEDPNEPYLIYLAESWKGLRVFRSLPGAPGKVDYFGAFNYSRGYALAVDVVGTFAYLADDEMGLTVMDVSVLVHEQMLVQAYCDTPGNARDIEVVDGYAYIADAQGGLQILRVNGAETPEIVGSLSLNGDSDAVAVRDGTAFVAADDGGLHVVDVRNPAHPVLLGSVLTEDAKDVALAEDGIVVVVDEVEGLVLFRGPHAFEDMTPPGTVFNLAATPRTAGSVQLTWTAPGDDGHVGQASAYDIRYDTDTITEETWADATPCAAPPVPSFAGEPDTFVVRGLALETQYFFALKTADEVPLWSGLSNVDSTETLGGLALTDASVSPLAATAESTIVYRVTYSSGEGHAPAAADVLIDGQPFAMTLATGDYVNGAVFEYETSLAVGSHTFAFSFDDGHGLVEETDPQDGPWVGVVLFEMGSPASEPGRGEDETVHTVVLAREFDAAAHEVTQASYDSLTGENPSFFSTGGAHRPVENVTWLDAVLYCNALSAQEGLPPCYTVAGDGVTWNRTANGYRLPTEAEWEYACRAGTGTAFSTGALTQERCDLDPALDLAGWYCGNADSMTMDVGLKAANAFGCYDMHGNVWEWCWDYYAEYGEDAAYDPSGPETGTQRVIRGGSWYYYARDCRSARRGVYWPNSSDNVVGFRVVKNAP